MGDLEERKFWNNYQKAYEEALSATSTESAPWFVIPADDKWYMRVAIAAVIYRQFQKLELNYPTVSAAQKKELQIAKKILLAEGTNKSL